MSKLFNKYNKKIWVKEVVKVKWSVSLIFRNNNDMEMTCKQGF